MNCVHEHCSWWQPHLAFVVAHPVGHLQGRMDRDFRDVSCGQAQAVHFAARLRRGAVPRQDHLVCLCSTHTKPDGLGNTCTGFVCYRHAHAATRVACMRWSQQAAMQTWQPSCALKGPVVWSVRPHLLDDRRGPQEPVKLWVKADKLAAAEPGRSLVRLPVYLCST